jgi:predicted Abi (CAAX) family protease
MEILVLACNILQKIVLFFWLFIFFHFAIVLSVFRLMGSDYRLAY